MLNIKENCNACSKYNNDILEQIVDARNNSLSPSTRYTSICPHNRITKATDCMSAIRRWRALAYDQMSKLTCFLTKNVITYSLLMRRCMIYEPVIHRIVHRIWCGSEIVSTMLNHTMRCASKRLVITCHAGILLVSQGGPRASC